MAIVQASLAEEVLSRQERAVIRGIYRAGQLTEALVMLGKVVETIKADSAAPIGQPTNTLKSATLDLANYLRRQIVCTLEGTKVPATPAMKTSSSQEQPVL